MIHPTKLALYSTKLQVNLLQLLLRIIETIAVIELLRAVAAAAKMARYEGMTSSHRSKVVPCSALGATRASFRGRTRPLARATPTEKEVTLELADPVTVTSIGL